jgi:glycosyltransferase involved in cell wall biosynthesis
MRSCPVPHVVTVHDLTPLAVPGDAPGSVRLNYRYRLGRILERADAIIADSEWTRHDIWRFYRIAAEKIQVIPLGYDRTLFRPQEDLSVLEAYGLENKPYLLAVGSDKPRKNLFRLARSFGMMQDKTHFLALAGLHGVDAKKRIMEEAKSFGVEARIVFLDYVREIDLPVLYSGATLFCYPSLYEGFGLPVLEAMACGTPVVAANATSIPEVAGAAAILVDPLRCEDIAAAMDSIIQNNQLRNSLRSAGLVRVNHFNWERTAVETFNLLESIR